MGRGGAGLRTHYASQAGIKLVGTLLPSVGIANVSYLTGHFCFLMVLFFDIVYECVSVCRCVCVGAGAHGGQQGATDPLELELQVFMSCLMWVIGTELGSSAS